MSGNQEGRTPAQFTLYNVMLPRIYHPALQGNMYERRCKVSLQRHGSHDQSLHSCVHLQAAYKHMPFLIPAWHQSYWPLIDGYHAGVCMLVLCHVCSTAAPSTACIEARNHVSGHITPASM